MIRLGEKIREYGQKKDINSLQEFMDKISTNEICDYVKNNISSSHFISEWNYILQSFVDSPTSHTKRLKVVLTLLKELDNTDLSSSGTNDLIHRICIDLAKFRAEHLIELCDYCNETIQANKLSQMSWKELLPDLLNALVEKESVEYNDIEMTGLDYKTQFINALCMAQWSPNIVTSLASMFVDLPLTKDEHLQIINKLGQYMEKLTPQEIPAFVYQLLKLCKHSNGRSVFIRLQNYFTLHIYDQPNFMDSNSESTTMSDLIESANERDVIDAESTVLYHIHSAASSGHESIKDYLNSLKSLMKSPELVLHPFQLTVLLTISTLPYYEQKVFEVIRFCTSRAFNEEEKKNNSLGFREMVSATCQIESIFAQIINLSMNDRHLVLQGLVNFAFVLLGVGSALGRDPIAEKQWNLGNMILLKIIKRKRNVVPTIIQTLSTSIVASQNVSQYIECMYILSKNLPLLMIENQSSIEKLMEHLLFIPPSTSNQLLDVIIPLTKVSPTMRDHLILLLRKALYSREEDTRQMAVNGFLKLLTTLKISNPLALSQSSSGSFSSGHSFFTQMSINRSCIQTTQSVFSNEALCLEVLGILRRCFAQQADVRSALYEGLYDTVCTNPDLGIPVLNVMWLHFNKYYILDEDSLPPLKFTSITVTKDLNVLLEEPLGKLIYSIGLIVTKISQKDDDNATVTKFKDVLESLCTRMIKCELVHLELDDGSDLLDVLPSCQQKLLILKEAISVYEALIGYKICSWSSESERNAQDVDNLFQGYLRLAHFSRNLSKPKKADSKKKQDVSTDQTNTSVRKETKQKGSSKGFKMPETVLGFQTICKALHLLHDAQLEWTSVSQANLVRSKKEIHQHFVQATITLIQHIKSKKIIDIGQSKLYYNYLSEIAVILYTRVIKRLSEFIDFDCITSEMVLECFHLILVIICGQYRSNLKSFLNTICNFEKGDAMLDALRSVITTYQKLFERDDLPTDDPECKKLDLLIINTLALLCNQIPQDSNAVSLQVMDWLKNIANNNTLSSRQVVSTFVTLLLDTHIKFKVSLTLFENMSVSLGNTIGLINEEEKQSEEFSIMDESHVQSVLQCLCASIKSILEEIDWVINRLKSEYYMITYPGIENVERKREHLKSKERGVCCQLCFIVSIMSNICNITVPPGPLSEAIMKNLSLLFCNLNSLTKYFMTRSSKVNVVFQGARFEHLVKLTGKQLAPIVYKFILYIEESQKEEATTNTQGKKKKNMDTNQLKNKVLRETRLIPKVVYELEQFSKSVIQLSNKTKVDLSKFVGQGVVRDFRIVHLKEVLEKVGDADETTFTTQQTEVNEENGTPDNIEDNTEIDASDEETGIQPAKRARL